MGLITPHLYRLFTPGVSPFPNPERGYPFADPLGVAVAIDPSLITHQEWLPVTVELNGTHTRGQTVVDWRDTSKLVREGRQKAEEANAKAHDHVFSAKKSTDNTAASQSQVQGAKEWWNGELVAGGSPRQFPFVRNVRAVITVDQLRFQVMMQTAVQNFEYCNKS